MRSLVLMTGAPGSGKSTLIEKLGLKQYTLCPDDIRLLFQSPIITVNGGHAISQNNDNRVWRFLFELLEQRMTRGEFTIVDATHSKKSEFKRYKKLASKYRYRVYAVSTRDIPIEECINRNLKRDKYKIVPADVIKKMYARFNTDIGHIPSWIKTVTPVELLGLLQWHEEDFSSFRKIVHIGDIHGCLSPLQKALGAPGNIYLDRSVAYIFVGDYIDRGPQNFRTLQYLLQIYDKPNVFMLEGNHESISDDTEILTYNGWKLAKYINGKDIIAQFDIKTKEITYERPIKVSSYIAKEWAEVKSNQGYEKVTLNHALILNNKRVKVNDIKDNEYTQADQYFSGFENKEGIELDDNLIKIITWLAMDGNIVKRNNKIHHLQFKLSKKQKINNLIYLLNIMNIPFTKHKATTSGLNKLQPYIIKIYGKYARKIGNYLNNKEFKNVWKKLNKHQIQMVLDVITKTDGRRANNHIEWTSTSKNNIDIIQYACITNDIPFKYTIREKASGFSNGKIQYHASIFPYGLVGTKIKIKKHNHPIKVVSITMPKDTLITRLKGRINFTGNSRLWYYANNEIENIRSKEFLNNTMPELDKYGIDKKELRNFYRSLYQVLKYKYYDKHVLVCHGGIPIYDINIPTIATEQLIKGVGAYKDYPVIAETWYNNYKNSNKYLINGHRNIQHLNTQVNSNVFNLEGNVEHGGYLRVVTLDKNGFYVDEFKNNYVRKDIEKEKMIKNIKDIKEFVEFLRSDSDVIEKKYGNISSFNFSKKAFFNKKWNDKTITARGLFINTETNEIVARSYNKFFNINERPETKIENLKMEFPVYAFVKYNGFLGLLGYDSELDELIFTSKSTTQGQYVDWFKQIFYKTVNENVEENLKRYLKKENVSLIFEVIDIKNDPHIIEYLNSKIVLLDVVKRDINFNTLSYRKLEKFGKQFGFFVKERDAVIIGQNALIRNINEIKEYNNNDIEGMVLVDKNNFMVKIKTNYYYKWKMFRSIKEKMTRFKNTSIIRDASLQSEDTILFYQWLKDLPHSKLKKSIITLRKEYYDRKS